jgi:hypothetical protein
MACRSDRDRGNPSSVTGLQPVSLNGRRSADSIEACSHRTVPEAGYMTASDLNATLQKPLQEGGPFSNRVSTVN